MTDGWPKIRFGSCRSPPPGDGLHDEGEPYGQLTLELSDVSQGLYTHVVAAFGLGKPGVQISQDIEHVVRHAASIFAEGELQNELADAIGLAREAEPRSICTIAALLLANACLLHRRLCETPGFESLPTLNNVNSASNSAALLGEAWQLIMRRDYAPVFEPALAALEALPDRRYVADTLRRIAECANRVADSLSELGYDHAGPLYHRILPSGKSDGALYTKNLSALMLARLALDEEFVDWSDPDQIARLRIMDPACGTGTLLMAALHVIKDRAQEHQTLEPDDISSLHRTLVEDVLCGLDINLHAIQLAACNLTLGAPTVNYQRMNLLTLNHGPQTDGSVRLGSLEMIRSDKNTSLQLLRRPPRNMDELDTEQVDRAETNEFPLNDLDLVIMNPPFTNNTQRNQKYGETATRQMQQSELNLRDEIRKTDPEAASVINSNSIETFFTPIADRLLHQRRGTFAKVMAVTACTSSGGMEGRRFIANRFHIERIITSHDPKNPNFSENTGIHESLIIARRKNAPPDPNRERMRLPSSFRSARCPVPRKKPSPPRMPSPVEISASGVGSRAGHVNASKRATGHRRSGSTAICFTPSTRSRLRPLLNLSDIDTR